MVNYPSANYMTGTESTVQKSDGPLYFATVNSAVKYIFAYRRC